MKFCTKSAHCCTSVVGWDHTVTNNNKSLRNAIKRSLSLDSYTAVDQITEI